MDIGTGTATVRLTISEDHIVRAETPNQRNPLSATGSEPFYVEFNPNVPLSLKDYAVALVCAMAGIDNPLG